MPKYKNTNMVKCSNYYSGDWSELILTSTDFGLNKCFPFDWQVQTVSMMTSKT